MNYVIGAIAGIAFGCLVGYLKYKIIWKGYAASDEFDAADHSGEAAKLYSRALISYAVNVIAMAVVFFLRNFYPFNWGACLIAVAISLAVMNRLMAFRIKKVTEKSMPSKLSTMSKEDEVQ